MNQEKNKELQVFTRNIQSEKLQLKNNTTNELDSSMDTAAEQICELREKVKELSLIKDCSSWSGGIIAGT